MVKKRTFESEKGKERSLRKGKKKEREDTARGTGRRERGNRRNRARGRIWKEVEKCSNRPRRKIFPGGMPKTEQDRRNVGT